MKLFHGSNQIIKEINLAYGASYKDFGKGFYLTPNRDTAQRMAKRRAWTDGGSPVIMTYDFDDNATSDPSIKVKKFTLDKDWLEFVNLNRNKSFKGKRHDYDIVIGPIANDGVAYLLGRWNEGTINLDTVLQQLRGHFLDTQYYFGTEKAIKFLHKIKSETL